MRFPRWTRGHVLATIAIVAGLVNVVAAFAGYDLGRRAHVPGSRALFEQFAIGLALLTVGLLQAHLIRRVSRSDS
jgi:hypothetical protein